MKSMISKFGMGPFTNYVTHFSRFFTTYLPLVTNSYILATTYLLITLLFASDTHTLGVISNMYSIRTIPKVKIACLWVCHDLEGRTNSKIP